MPASPSSFYLENIASFQTQLQQLLQQQPSAYSLIGVLHSHAQNMFATRPPPIEAQEIRYEKNLWFITVPDRRVYAPAGYSVNGLQRLLAQRPWAGGVLQDNGFYRACLQSANSTLYSNPSFESLIESMVRSPDQLYARQLDAFWNGAYSDTDLRTRRQWLADIQRSALQALAALRLEDGTLGLHFRHMLDHLYRCPSAIQRASAPSEQRPSTLKASVHIADGLPDIDLLNTFILTTKTPGSSINADTDCGPVVLCCNINGIQTFDSLRALQQALQARLAAPSSRHQLLRNVPWHAHGRIERHPQRSISFTTVEGNIFEYAAQALLDQQRSDLAFTWQTLPKDETDFAALQEAFDHAADIGPLLDLGHGLKARAILLLEKHRPDWYIALDPANGIRLRQYLDDDHAQNKTLARLLMQKQIPSLQAYTRKRIKEYFAPRFVDLDPETVQVVFTTVSSPINPSGSSTPTIGGPAAEYPKKIDLERMTLTQFVLRNVDPWDVTYMKLLARTNSRLHAHYLHKAPTEVLLNNDELRALAKDLDAGQGYDELLHEQMIVQGAELRESWRRAYLATLKANALVAHLENTRFLPDRLNRGYEWVKALIDHPLPALRSVEGQLIVANILQIGNSPRARNGYELNNVLVLSAQHPASVPNVVLYTPNGPDGQEFKEFKDLGTLKCVLKDQWASSPPWVRYFQERLTTEGKRSLEHKAFSQDWMKTFLSASRHRAGNPFDTLRLVPVNGNVHESMYDQLVHTLRHSAGSESTTNAEVKKQSVMNKIMFGVEVGLDILGFLPVTSTLTALSHIRQIYLMLAQIKKSRSAANQIWSLIGSNSRVVLTTPSALPPALSSLPPAPANPLVPVPSKDLRQMSGNLYRNNAGSEYFVRIGDDFHPSLQIQGQRYIHDPAFPNIRYLVAQDELTDIWSFVPRERQLRLLGGGDDAPRTGADTPLNSYHLSPAHRNELAAFATERFGILNLANSQLYAPATRAFQRHLEAVRERLTQDAQRSLVQFRPAPKPRLAQANHTDVRALIEEILDQHPGLVVAEMHTHSIARQFLIENMPTFHQQGVRVLYLEAFSWDLHQTALDRFFLSRTGEHTPELKTLLQQIDQVTNANDAFTYRRLIDTARAQGIRPVAIDCLASCSIAAIKPFSLDMLQQRLRTMNYHAAKLINADQVQRGASRWVALVGCGHVNQYLGVRGIADMTNAVGARISSVDRALSAHAFRDPGEATYHGNVQHPIKLQCDLLINLPGTPVTSFPEFRLHSKGMFSLERNLTQLPILHYRNRQNQLTRSAILSRNSKYYLDDAEFGALLHQRFDSLQALVNALTTDYQMVCV